jgi:Tol biopolymer transport system component
MDTGVERELVPGFRSMSALRWSPDGGSLLVAGTDRKGRFGLHILDAQTAASEEFIAGGYQGEWLRDGSGVVFGKNESFASRPLKLFDLANREERTLHDCLAGLARAVSPDGRFVAFSCFDNGSVLRVMPVGVGEARDVFRPREPLHFGSIAWSADGRQLLFVMRGLPDVENELWRVAATGGEPQRLGLALSSMSQLSVHPDGRTLAFSTGETRSEVWVIENLLPASKMTAAPRARRR